MKEKFKQLNTKINKFTKKYNGLLIIIGIIISLIAIAYSAYVAHRPVEIKKTPSKELTCTLNYSQPLIINKIKDDDFKILYKEKEVENPYLYSITIKNTGCEPIKNEDFIKPLSIEFQQSKNIIKASIIQSSNKDIWDDFIKNSNIEGITLNTSNFFLNQDEFFIINVITDGKAESINYKKRIAGIPKLNIKNIPEENNHKFDTIRYIMLTISITLPILTTLFAFISYRRDKAYIKKIDSKYRKNESNK